MQRAPCTNPLSRRKFLLGSSSLGALMLAGAGLKPVFANEKAPDVARAFTEALAAFGAGLYAKLAARTPGNFVFSPYSIGTALAMSRSGARGATEAELATVLGLSLTRQETEEASGKVMAVLRSYDRTADPKFCPDGARWTGAQCEAPLPTDRRCHFPLRRKNEQCVGSPQLRSSRLLVANALMLANYGNLVSDVYRTLLAERYAAEIFAGATADLVNAWVKEKTAGKIDHIIDMLPEQTAMVLANAIYFNAAWNAQFSESETRVAPFHLSRTTQIATPFMNQTAYFSVLARPGYRAIRLPYADEALAMVVVLPDRIEGLPALAESLMRQEAAKLLSASESGQSRRVALALPRFKLKADFELTSLLTEQGLRTAVTDAADFSGVTGGQAARNGIKIGQIRHKAVIEVMEKGTEAAAATVESYWASGIRPPEPEPELFVADRPFMFFIADAATGAVLFQGRVADPSQQA